MLQTVERMPHVHVTVNGVNASCKGSGGTIHATRFSQSTSCQFVYSQDSKPVVAFLSPDSGIAGDVVTIYGSGFDPNIEEYDVRFGDVPCNVTSANETEVQCIIGESHAGKHQLHFQVFSSGKSNTSLFLMYKLNFVLQHPSHGSLGGGLTATLSGHGFVGLHTYTSISQMVLFGAIPCDVVDSSYSVIHCIVPPHDIPGAVNITVVVYTKDEEEISVTAIDEFIYSETNTPHVHSVEPKVGSAGGGTVVTITGSGFSMTAEENSVKVER